MSSGKALSFTSKNECVNKQGDEGDGTPLGNPPVYCGVGLDGPCTLLLPVEQWQWLRVFGGHMAVFCSLPPGGDPQGAGAGPSETLFLPPTSCLGT